MTKLTKAIERFFRDGQKEPSPLLEALREAAAEGLRMRRFLRPAEAGFGCACKAAAEELSGCRRLLFLLMASTALSSSRTNFPTFFAPE